MSGKGESGSKAHRSLRLAAVDDMQLLAVQRICARLQLKVSSLEGVHFRLLPRVAHVVEFTAQIEVSHILAHHNAMRQVIAYIPRHGPLNWRCGHDCAAQPSYTRIQTISHAHPHTRTHARARTHTPISAKPGTGTVIPSASPVIMQDFASPPQAISSGISSPLLNSRDRSRYLGPGESQRDRETERQRDRETERQRDRERETRPSARRSDDRRSPSTAKRCALSRLFHRGKDLRPHRSAALPRTPGVGALFKLVCRFDWVQSDIRTETGSAVPSAEYRKPILSSNEITLC